MNENKRICAMTQELLNICERTWKDHLDFLRGSPEGRQVMSSLFQIDNLASNIDILASHSLSLGELGAPNA